MSRRRKNCRWSRLAAGALGLVLLILVPILGGGCGSARETVEALKKEKDELVSRLAELGADRERLTAELEKLRQRGEALLAELKALGWAEKAGAPDLALTGVSIVTDQKDEEGRLYGAFSVRATVKNRGTAEAGPVSVGAVLLITNNRYASLVPQVSAACGRTERLGAGEEATLDLTGLSTGHPELDHQLLVSVHAAQDEPNTANNVKQLVLKVRFAPGSAD